MRILGINAYHGDASAALLIDGVLVAAAEEERFNRIKHSAGFPAEAVRFCLEQARIRPEDIDVVAVGRDPRARLARRLWYAARLPYRALERWQARRRFATLHEDLAAALGVAPERLPARVQRVEHHCAHMASAFFASPFDRAAVLSVDGLGDFASASWGVGEGSVLRPLGAVPFPHSLGFLYTAVTQFLGFPKYGDEYKVMGLAAYGEAEFLEEFRNLVRSEDGTCGFRLDLGYFSHHTRGVEMTWEEGEPTIGRLFSERFVRRFGKPRDAGEPLEDRHRALAASLQRRTEELLVESARRLRARTGLPNLCLAGGVAFNCVANGRILREAGFESVYVAPAAGDAGLAVGAALWVWHHVLGHPRRFVMDHAYWGPGFGDEEIGASLARAESRIRAAGSRARRFRSYEELSSWAARRLAEGAVVGWFQGRMEWGPRALGNRSILADPRRADMREILNVRIKKREPFRPFAPAILEEAAGRYFELPGPSPFMLVACPVRPEKKKEIPATTHVDGTARVQTVNTQQNPAFHALLRAFERETGVPVLLNTSFNENEPVVCRPEEALDCFLRTNMDVLVLGSWVVERNGTGSGDTP